MLVDYEEKTVNLKWSTKFKYKIEIFNGMSRNEASHINYGLTRIAGIHSDKNKNHLTLFAFDIF